VNAISTAQVEHFNVFGCVRASFVGIVSGIFWRACEIRDLPLPLPWPWLDRGRKFICGGEDAGVVFADEGEENDEDAKESSVLADAELDCRRRNG